MTAVLADMLWPGWPSLLVCMRYVALASEKKTL